MLCGNCVSRFTIKPEVRDSNAHEDDQKKVVCFVCDLNLNETEKKGEKFCKNKDLETTKSEIVEIRCEGTGFASGGLSAVKKVGIAFQC